MNLLKTLALVATVLLLPVAVASFWWPKLLIAAVALLIVSFLPGLVGRYSPFIKGGKDLKEYEKSPMTQLRRSVIDAGTRAAPYIKGGCRR